MFTNEYLLVRILFLQNLVMAKVDQKVLKRTDISGSIMFKRKALKAND